MRNFRLLAGLLLLISFPAFGSVYGSFKTAISSGTPLNSVFNTSDTSNSLVLQNQNYIGWLNVCNETGARVEVNFNTSSGAAPASGSGFYLPNQMCAWGVQAPFGTRLYIRADSSVVTGGAVHGWTEQHGVN